MSNSYLINQIRLSPQSSSRNGVIVDTFLIHHQAGTNDDDVINAMVTGSKQVSANYTISNEGRVTLVVDESLRSWSAGSSTDGGKGAAWDRRSITVEIENETGAPNWTISQIAKQTAANLLADLKSRYNIKNVLGHRDLWNMYSASYPTFCPGPNTVAEIIALTPPAPILIPTENNPPSELWAFNIPNSYTQARIQRALKARNRYNGPSDGVWGPQTIKGIQTTAHNVGYNGPIDGIPGPSTCHYIQIYAQKFGSYTGPIDSILGPNTWNGFALGLERP